jgi:hypothetical protein
MAAALATAALATAASQLCRMRYNLDTVQTVLLLLPVMGQYRQ